MYSSQYDGKVPRHTCQCGYVDKVTGERCGVVGEWNQNPEAPAPRKHKILCMDHAREEGRLDNGRNSHLRRYVMCMSQEDKERARKLMKCDRAAKRMRPEKSPGNIRTKMVTLWLGTDAFKELDPHRTRAVLAQLRIPPPLVGDDKHRTHIYLLDSFSLADLDYLYKTRPSDGRRLYLVRGSSIIR